MAAAAAGAAGSARAEQADAGVVWRCWYDADRTAVACRVEQAGADEEDDGAMAAYPPMLRILRLSPGMLAGQVIHVPLHSPPIGWSLTERLLRAVFCNGRRGACRVDFTVAPP